MSTKPTAGERIAQKFIVWMEAKDCYVDGRGVEDWNSVLAQLIDSEISAAGGVAGQGKEETFADIMHRYLNEGQFYQFVDRLVHEKFEAWKNHVSYETR